MDNEISTIENTAESHIGTLLLKTGKLKANDVERISALQKQNGLLFGEAAKALGLVSDDDINRALAHQFHYNVLSPDDETLSKELVAAYEPFSSEVETLRTIREQIKLHSGQQHKVLAVVSAERGEGRSWLVANLGIVFAQLGQRTLIVDADLRQPRQQEYFKIKQQYGLSDILAKRAEYSIIKTIAGFDNLSVLIAGTIVPNPLELLSQELKNYLDQCQNHYDIILVDTPSVEQAIDAEIIAQKSGAILLLAKLHQTKLTKLKLVKDAIQETGVDCLGAIITDF